MVAFWKGLNAFRLSPYGKVFRVSERMPENYYQWILPEDKSMLGYIVDNKVLVLINAGNTNNTFEKVSIPNGHWKLIGTNSLIKVVSQSSYITTQNTCHLRSRCTFLLFNQQQNCILYK